MSASQYDRMSKKDLIDRLIEAERQLRRSGTAHRPERGPAAPRRSGKGPGPAAKQGKKQHVPSGVPAGADVNFASESDCTVLDRDGRIRRLYRVVKDIQDDAGNPVFSEGALYEIGTKTGGAPGNGQPGNPGESDQTELICRFRPNGALTYVNEAYCRYFGCEREDLRGRNVLLSISEADREKVYSRLKELRPERPADTLEYRVENVFGDVLWNQWTYRALFDDSGNVLEYQSIGRDITFRKYTQDVLEKRAAILEAVTYASEAFLKSSSWRERIERVLERFGAAMNASHVFLCENQVGEGGGITVLRSYEWLAPESGGKGSRQEFLRNSELAVRFSEWVYARSEGRPIYGTIGSFPEQAVDELKLDRQLPIAVVPILSGDRWWGFIAFADYTGGIRWNDDEIAPLGAASEILGAAIEREEKEKTLRETHAAVRSQERFLAGVFDAIQDGIMVASPDLTILRVNKTVEKRFPHIQALPGRKCHEALYGLESPCGDCACRKTIETANAVSMTRPILGPGGECRGWVEVFSYPWVDHDTGTLKGVIEYSRDITDKKKAEEALLASEARYRELADHLPVGVYEADVDGMFTYSNSMARKIFGYGEEDVRAGMHFLQVIAPEEHEIARKRAQSVRQGNTVSHIEHTFLRKDGTRFSGLLMARPLIRDGQIVGSTGVATDISELKRAQEALRKNEALLESILQAAPVGVGMVRDRVFGWVNDGMTVLTGYDGRELQDKSARILYPDQEEFERAGREKYAEIRARGKGSVETRWRRKDGAVIDIHLSSAPIDRGDPDAGVVFTALDITAQKKAARILLFAKKDLEKQVAEQTRELDVANMLLRIELEEHRKTEEALVKSEELYRAIVKDQTEIICRFRPDGTMSFVNEAFCRYFGKIREEVVGSRYLPAIPREDRKRLWAAYGALTPDRPVFSTEFRIGMPDGAVRWLHWTNRAIYDASGALVEHQGVGRDVTERITSEQQIRESRNTLRAVFDGISDPLVMVREDLTVIMLNRASLQFLGASQYRELIGTSCLEPLRERYGRGEADLVRAAIAGQEPARFELATGGDAVRYEEVFVYPVEAGGEGRRTAIIRVTDRTKQRLMERELIQSEKLASLGLLISGIVHEINNPNNFISFNMPILRDYIRDILPVLDDHAARKPGYEVQGMPYADFRADMLKLIENVEHGSARINTTVAKLREFSRRKDERGARPILPAAVVEKAVSLCRTQIRKTVKTFEVQVQPDLPEMVTDPDAVEQTLINLLINAAQAADKPDSRILLRVRQGTSGEGLILEVEDNGCGMDGRTASRLFDPFFTTKEEGLGTGLGLYISKNLIEPVRGSIAVESEIGRGTTFRVVLPDLTGPGDRAHASEKKGVDS